MAKVVLSVNCPPRENSCVKRKLAFAKGLGAWAHLDIADGAFTFHKSWNEPDKWPEGAESTEVHCMVENPLALITVWNHIPSVKRFIVHVETVTPETFHVIQEKVRSRGKSIMLALNPETPVSRLEPYLDHAIQFQILAVHPGLSGQKFLPLVLKKISWIRERMPNAIIEVDGGITPEVARRARHAGADILVSDHYVFDHADPVKAYEELTQT